MGNIFKKLFGGGPKINLPGREAISSDYMQFPGAQEAYKGYQSKIGGAPGMAQRYYDYMYQPTAEAARSQWSGYVEPEISSQASARGMGRSSLVADLLRRSAQEREMGLAQYGGELRQKGYETGLGEENIGLQGLERTAGQSAEQQARAANWQSDLAQRLYTGQTERFGREQAGAGRAISLGASLAAAPFTGGASLAAIPGTFSGGGGGGSDLIAQLLKRNQRTPFSMAGGAGGASYGIGG